MHGGTLRADDGDLGRSAADSRLHRQRLDVRGNAGGVGTAPTPLRVELTYACTSAGVIDDRTGGGHALVGGAGPGQTVGAVCDALTTPDGSQQGLQGEYVLQAQAQRRA